METRIVPLRMCGVAIGTVGMQPGNAHTKPVGATKYPKAVKSMPRNIQRLRKKEFAADLGDVEIPANPALKNRLRAHAGADAAGGRLCAVLHGRDTFTDGRNPTSVSPNTDDAMTKMRLEKPFLWCLSREF